MNQFSHNYVYLLVIITVLCGDRRHAHNVILGTTVPRTLHTMTIRCVLKVTTAPQEPHLHTSTHVLKGLIIQSMVLIPWTIVWTVLLVNIVKVSKSPYMHNIENKTEQYLKCAWHCGFHFQILSASFVWRLEKFDLLALLTGYPSFSCFSWWYRHAHW